MLIRTKRAILAALTAIACAAVLLGCGGTEGSTQSPPPVEEPAREQLLEEFCGDPEVSDFFASLEKDPPVKLDYWIYGMAPYDMIFTDPDLILRTAKALQTVVIGRESREDPNNVNDAGGQGFVFEKADGSRISFVFLMGSFSWKDGPYHDVYSYGDLKEVAKDLDVIGNPQDIFVYSEDNGFYTECPETCRVSWEAEDGFGGGLFLYPGESNYSYVQICRCGKEEDGVTEDPETFLKEALPGYLEGKFAADMLTVKETGELQEYQIGGKNLSGIRYSLSDAEGRVWEMLVLIMKAKDSLLGEQHLIQFSAEYNVAEDKETLSALLEKAVKSFGLKHVYYEQREVQPGNTLLDFCNDDGMRAWFAHAEKKGLDQLVYTEDEWHIISDPEKIREVLEALKTVRIGDVSSKHVGGADRKIYDFYSENGNVTQSFQFFGPCFFYNGVDYDVLDYGKLKDIKLE